MLQQWNIVVHFPAEKEIIILFSSSCIALLNCKFFVHSQLVYVCMRVYECFFFIQSRQKISSFVSICRLSTQRFLFFLFYILLLFLIIFFRAFFLFAFSFLFDFVYTRMMLFSCSFILISFVPKATDRGRERERERQ